MHTHIYKLACISNTLTPILCDINDMHCCWRIGCFCIGLHLCTFRNVHTLKQNQATDVEGTSTCFQKLNYVSCWSRWKERMCCNGHRRRTIGSWWPAGTKKRLCTVVVHFCGAVLLRCPLWLASEHSFPAFSIVVFRPAEELRGKGLVKWHRPSTNNFQTHAVHRTLFILWPLCLCVCARVCASHYLPHMTCPLRWAICSLRILYTNPKYDGISILRQK